MATTEGAPELLRRLLDAGANVTVPNMQGQSALGALKALRQVASQLAGIRAMGVKLPKAQMEHFERMLPAEGWDECERLLKERGGR